MLLGVQVVPLGIQKVLQAVQALGVMLPLLQFILLQTTEQKVWDHCEVGGRRARRVRRKRRLFPMPMLFMLLMLRMLYDVDG